MSSKFKYRLYKLLCKYFDGKFFLQLLQVSLYSLLWTNSQYHLLKGKRSPSRQYNLFGWEKKKTLYYYLFAHLSLLMINGFAKTVRFLLSQNHNSNEKRKKKTQQQQNFRFDKYPVQRQLRNELRRLRLLRPKFVPILERPT